MKYQHLGVIFCIIIIPISMVLAMYTQNLVKVSDREAYYASLLYNSTYDGIRAFQMNSINNNYSSEKNSRVRDINASINSFFNSMAVGLSSSGYNKEQLKNYIPSIVYNLYDGFYINSLYTNIAKIKTYDNIRLEDGSLGTKKVVEFLEDNIDLNKKPEDGLKSFNYYSIKYKNNNYDIVVNFTLDNFISVYARYFDMYGVEKYTAMQGYYINPNGISFDDRNFIAILSDGTRIEPETLGEYVKTIDYRYEKVDNRAEFKISSNPIRYYNYVIYNNLKYYFDDDLLGGGSAYGTQIPQTEVVGGRSVTFGFNSTYEGIPIFRLENNKRIYIGLDELANIYMATHGRVNQLGNKDYFRNNGINLAAYFNNKENEYKDLNSYYYYKNAVDFSKTVYPILKQVDLNERDEGGNLYKVIDSDSFKMQYKVNDNLSASSSDEINAYDINIYRNGHIFDYELEENKNPELYGSLFNLHREDVIATKIQHGLINSIKNFDLYISGGYKYKMPTISKLDWGTIANNSCMLTTMDGVSIGNFKNFTGYALVKNAKTVEFISKEEILVLDDFQKNYNWNRNILIDQKINENSIPGSLYKTNQYNNESVFYHDPRSLSYSENITKKQLSNPSYAVKAYRSLDFDRDSISVKEDGENEQKTIYYYYQPGTPAYDSVVTRNNFVSEQATNELLSGDRKINSEIRKQYLSALARYRGAIQKMVRVDNYIINITNNVKNTG